MKPISSLRYLVGLTVGIALGLGVITWAAWDREQERLLLYGLDYVAVVGLISLLFWQRRSEASQLRMWEIERERQALAERLALITLYANDAIILYDEQMRIVEANERAGELYGWTLAELKARTARDLRVESEGAQLARDFAAAMEQDGILLEATHRTKQGRVFWAEVSARHVMFAGKRHVLCMVRDITERKQQEKEIEQLNRMYFLSSRVNEVLVHAKSRDELFADICRIMVEIGSYPLAWVGWFDEATQLLPAVATAGVGQDFVAGLRISADPQLVTGQGPVGTAFREGRCYVCNDFSADASTQPWRERAEKIGLAGCLVLPLLVSGRPQGVLAIYAVEKNCFGEREILLLTAAAEDISFGLELFTAEEKRKAAELALVDSHRFNVKVLDSLTDHVVVLDDTGVILSLNEAWRHFAEVNGAANQSTVSVGTNYLAACVDAPNYPDADDAACAKQGISAVLSGEREFFHMEYACHAPDQERWFEMRVSPLQGGRRGAVVTHKDTTERKRAETKMIRQAQLTKVLLELPQAAEELAEKVFLQRALADMEKISGSLIGFVHFVHADQQTLELVTWSEQTLAQYCRAHHEAHYPVNAAGIWADALRERRPVMFNDYANYPAKHGLPPGHSELKRLISVPVLERGKVVMLTGVGNKATDYTAQDIEAVQLISQAMWRLVQRRRSLTQLTQFSRIIEQAPLSVAITDLTGKIEYVNPKFTEVSGYTLEELRGQNPRLLKSGDTPAEVYRDMWQTLQAGEVWRGEFTNRRKNGTNYTELAVIAPVAGEAGVYDHYVALKEDITERKVEEALLNQSLMELRTLHALSQAMQRRDLAGAELMEVVVAQLPAGMRWASLAQAVIQLDGQTYRAGVAGDQTHTMTSLIVINGRSAGKIQLGYVADKELPMASGEVFLRPEAEMLENVARTIALGLGWREAFAQIERFNSELEILVAERTAALDASNREVRALLQAIPDMVMRVGLDGTVQSCQRSRGVSGLAVVPFDSQANPPAPLLAFSLPLGRQAVREQTLVSAETDLSLTVGPMALEFRAAPLSENQFVVFVRDITARKQLEIETKAMLEKERQISEMRTRFISVTSHEFRTPMAAAMGSVEILSNHFDRLTVSKRHELLDRVGASLRRMTEMLDDVLTLNRMDAKRTSACLVEVNLLRLVRDMVEEIRLGDHEAHQFQVDAGDGLESIVSDAQLLRHILSNLLSNAVRYSPEGSLISVRLRRDAWRVELEVADQGIGVPAGDRERIFEAFERGSNVSTIKGTGLGLNIVKRMLELLGGTITVTSLDPGSCFVIALPLGSLTPPPS